MGSLNPQWNKKSSEEHRANISKGKANQKTPVYVNESDGVTFVIRYHSLTPISRSFGLNKNSIKQPSLNGSLFLGQSKLPHNSPKHIV